MRSIQEMNPKMVELPPLRIRLPRRRSSRSGRRCRIPKVMAKLRDTSFKHCEMGDCWILRERVDDCPRKASPINLRPFLFCLFDPQGRQQIRVCSVGLNKPLRDPLEMDFRSAKVSAVNKSGDWNEHCLLAHVLYKKQAPVLGLRDICRKPSESSPFLVETLRGS